MASRHQPDSCDDNTMEMLSANLPSNAFATSTPDPRLERARQETERTNQITPLLKEELRLRILSKRLEKGEPDIEMNSPETRSYELSEEEKAKRERRKAQNRRAAKKCREKRKMKTLSDAEKYRVVRDENQQLRNDVTYLRHKEEVLRQFCTEHILNGQCSTVPSDESIKRRLVTLLASTTKREHVHLYQALNTATPLRSRGDENQVEATSSSLFPHSFFQGPPHAACTSGSVSLPNTAAQAVYQAEQQVTTIQELTELPVHEISSLLPTEPDFSVSDHSLESTPPDLSPTSLFNTMSPISVAVTSSGGAGSSFFSHLTPSTSFSGNNTSSFSSSNDDILQASHSDSSLLMNTSFPDPSCSTAGTPLQLSQSYYQEGANSNQEISRKMFAADSYGQMSSTPETAYQTGKHCFRGRYNGDPNLNSVVGPDSFKPNEDGRHVLSRSGINNVIINTAAYGEFSDLHCLLSSYLSTEQIDVLACHVSSCEADPLAQTLPESPLSPVSISSPRVSLSPRSPCPVSVDTKHKDYSLTPFQSSAVGVSHSVTPNPATPARHVIRRASSTTSVPSPYFHQQMSITLSPPPSVPSPTSNGVPESPSILPHFSPVSSATSDDCSPARFFEACKEEFN